MNHNKIYDFYKNILNKINIQTYIKKSTKTTMHNYFDAAIEPKGYTETQTPRKDAR
jgi:hypothetical protein